MAISIMGGIDGITVESDPTALKLTGGTLTGRINTFSPTSTDAGINIGSIDSTANLSNSVAGDIWLGRFQLTYKNHQGSIIYGAATNATNVFGSPQIIDTTSATSGLRVTQKGTGHAFLVEDSTNPDTTATFISNAGLVYVNYDPAGSLPTGAVLNINGNVNFDGQTPTTHSNAFTVYNKEFLISIGGFSYAIPCRAI